MNNNDDVLLLIFERNQFYRRQYLLALGAFGLCLIVMAVLFIVLIYVIRNPTAPLYFATDNVGRLISVVPVTQPNMKTEEVMKWAVNAVEKVNSYDYVNYREQLQGAQKYFTPYGWNKYMDAVKSTNNLVALTREKMIFDAKVIGDPVLEVQGILGGAYAWKFKMPMLVTYWKSPYDEESKFANAQSVSVIVQRQPILQSSDGVGIVQLVQDNVSAPQSEGESISSVPSG